MTYSEAVGECSRREAERRAASERRRAEIVPLPPLPPEAPFEDRLRNMLYHNPGFYEAMVDEPRRRARGDAHLDSSHSDGRTRWVRGYLVEGDPNHPWWQAKLDLCPLFEEWEKDEDDWWVETYDAMDF